MMKLIVAMFLVGVVACGESTPKYGSLRSIAANQSVDSNDAARSAKDYQIGVEMGKTPVTLNALANETDIFIRAAKATASTGGATAFYLGKFDGHHVVATNHHVFPKRSSCRQVRFPFLENKTFRCIKYFGTWDSIDLTLFAIEVKTESDEKLLEAVAQNFDFRSSYAQGDRLLTIGFGIAANPRRQMMSNKDSDCKVFSKEDDYKLLADPDEFNPGPYKAWSFAIGCDVSHGDSGSAIVSRETGSIIGIIWTGKIPKKKAVQQPGYTDRILAENSSDIWTELSLAVPAAKIASTLLAASQSLATPKETKDVITALLAD